MSLDTMDRCTAHADTIDAWRTKVDVVVSAMAAQNTAQLVSIGDIRSDLRLLCERIPPDLKTEFTKVQGKLDSLHTEFHLLRSQVYWVIGLFVTAFVLGLAGFVIRGGLK